METALFVNGTRSTSRATTGIQPLHLAHGLGMPFLSALPAPAEGVILINSLSLDVLQIKQLFGGCESL
jgi:hypothetical protein